VQGKESRIDSEGSWQYDFLTSIEETEEVVCVQEQCRGWPLNSLCDRKLPASKSVNRVSACLADAKTAITIATGRTGRRVASDKPT
jgi:hypothetical protein